jgi:AcrR family transcriptional regulator/DNA-binding MarR family transcriptional regulator
MSERRRVMSGRAVRDGSASARVQVSGVQRARVLASAVRVLAEDGYEGMSVARVTRGARVSRRTFYDLFEGREDCFLAVFEDALGRVSERVRDAYAGVEGKDWCERVRAGLQELLRFFDEEPSLARVLVVDALRAGPRVLVCRAEVLAGVAAAIQEGGVRARRGRGEQFSALTGEGVVGGVFAVLHTRLSAEHPTGGLLGLLNQLMAMIALPYQGPATWRRELQRPAVEPVARQRTRSRSGNGMSGSSLSGSDPLAGLPMRLTYRTLCVLEGIAECPGASNRVVADRAGVTDQGQISKLLARLERLGLIENSTGQGHRPTGEPNVWRLTSRGEEVWRATQVGARGGRDAHEDTHDINRRVR